MLTIQHDRARHSARGSRPLRVGSTPASFFAARTAWHLGPCGVAAGLLFLLWPVLATAVTVPGNFPTIQAAINAVVAGNQPDGTVIDVQPGTYAEALVVVDTARSLTVRATAGPGSTVINATGRGVSAIIVLRATGNVRFEGFTVTGGRGGPGSDTGGGLTVQDAAPTFTNMVFDGNTSSTHGGGGTLLRASPVFDGCTFQNNQAASLGGGLLILSSSPVFANSVIRNNISGLSDPNGAGGGVAIQGAGNTTIRSSTISGNQSKAAGGGIFAQTLYTNPGPTTVTVQDTEVSGNTASRFSPVVPEAFGGGIHVEDNVIARLTRARISGNTANSGGGLSTFRARFEVTSSFIESNQATDDPSNLASGLGGGVVAVTTNGTVPFVPSAAVLMTDSVVRNNTAREGGGLWVAGDLLCGGGPCTPATAPRTQLTIMTSLVDNNTAVQPWAGGIFGQRADISIAQSQIFRNRVTGTGARGGGLTILASTATITNSTLAGNSAPAEGGGLYVDLQSAITVNGSNLHRNSGSQGGAIFAVPPATGIVQNSVIADNVGIQIAEAVPAPCAGIPVLMYVNNVIAAQGATNIYRSSCIPPGDVTVAGLNALPSGRASGNTSGPPVFASFRATPGQGASVLGWSVARATAINISSLGSVPAPTGTQDVNPPCPATFNLTADTFAGPVAASVSCVVAGASATLTVSPPTGHYTSQQGFDLVALVEPGGSSPALLGATLDGRDVSGAFRSCVLAGTLLGAGQTFRCPGLSGALFGAGSNTLTITTSLVGGGQASQTVMLTVDAPVPGVTVSPASGTLVSTQGFDLSIIVNMRGRTVVSGAATLNGANVLPALLSCVRTDVLPGGNLAFRCPGLRGSLLAPGVNTFNVTVNFSDGSSAASSATWQVRPNTEP